MSTTEPTDGSGTRTEAMLPGDDLDVLMLREVGEIAFCDDGGAWIRADVTHAVLDVEDRR